MKHLLIKLTLLTGLALTLQTSLAQPPDARWTLQTDGAIWSNPVGDGHHLWVGSDDHQLYKLEQASGKTVWTFTSGGRIRSEAVLDDKNVYFTADDGYLYALDKTTGEQRYRVQLGQTQQARQLPAYEENNRFDWPGSSPLLAGGVIYTGSASGELYALDAANGRERWRFASEGVIRSRPALIGNTLVVGSWDGRLYGLDVTTGEQQWQFATGAPVLSNIATWNQLAIVGGRSAVLYAFNASSGELAWEFKHESGSWVESSVTVVDDKLYVGSSDALQLLCLEAATGELHWSFSTGGWSWGTPAVTAETVFIGSFSVHPHWQADMKRGLYAVARQSGELRAFYPAAETEGYITGGVATRPLVTDKLLIVAALDGSITAYPRPTH